MCVFNTWQYLKITRNCLWFSSFFASLSTRMCCSNKALQHLFKIPKMSPNHPDHCLIQSLCAVSRLNNANILANFDYVVLGHASSWESAEKSAGLDQLLMLPPDVPEMQLFDLRWPDTDINVIQLWQLWDRHVLCLIESSNWFTKSINSLSLRPFLHHCLFLLIDIIYAFWCLS